MTRGRAFFHWLGHPFRAIANLLRTLINLTRQQMRAIFSLGMLLGIIALSFQNMVLLYWVFSFLKGAAPGSLFGQMALSQQFWNNAIAAGFAAIVALVVWGADYLKAKYGGVELEAGDGKLKIDATQAPPETGKAGGAPQADAEIV
jgi:hypothetical protein